jgi:hypothetical protein
MFKMSLKIDGREVSPGNAGRMMMQSISRRLQASANSKLDGLWCPEHQQAPSAICTDNGGSIKVNACCSTMLGHVRLRLGPPTALASADDPAEHSDASDRISQTRADLPNESRAETRPKAFLSHASADKERIARPLDALLRARGIDVWLDERDLLPGRNLVEEIFTHGISKSDVFIVVLSSNSIDRPWVTEELSVAVVRRINGIVKLIVPIVIDGIQPPEALVATVWERIPDLDKLELHADRIAASVIGTTPPPIAPKPAYAGIAVHRLAGLEPNDERIFVFACEQLLANATAYPLVQLSQIADQAAALGMSEEQVYESIAALENAHFLHELGHYLGENRPLHARIPGLAFERYLKAYRPTEYRREKLAILAAIVNEGASHSREIAATLCIHEYVVDHVLEALESSSHVMASHSMDGIHVRANPTLARVLRQMEAEGRRPE